MFEDEDRIADLDMIAVIERPIDFDCLLVEQRAVLAPQIAQMPRPLVQDQEGMIARHARVDNLNRIVGSAANGGHRLAQREYHSLMLTPLDNEPTRGTTFGNWIGKVQGALPIIGI